jgi:hypothetical protein
MPSKKDNKDSLPESGFMPLKAIPKGQSPEEMEWLTDSTLSIVIVGASGDLAKVRMNKWLRAGCARDERLNSAFPSIYRKRHFRVYSTCTTTTFSPKTFA